MNAALFPFLLLSLTLGIAGAMFLGDYVVHGLRLPTEPRGWGVVPWVAVVLVAGGATVPFAKAPRPDLFLLSLEIAACTGVAVFAGAKVGMWLGRRW